MITEWVTIVIVGTVIIKRIDEMERPTRLTQAFVDCINAPGRYSDGRRAFGLTLLVKPLKNGSGLSKSYSQRLAMPDGTQKTFGLGAHPVTSLKMARDSALANAQIVRASRSSIPSKSLLTTLNNAKPFSLVEIIPQTPVIESATVDAPVFREVADITIDALRGSWKVKPEQKMSHTERMWHTQLENHVYPFIGDTPVNRIESGDVVRVLNRIWTGAHPTAKQVRWKLAKIFDHAIGRNLIEFNPVERASKALPKIRHTAEPQRAIEYHEMPETMERIQSARVRFPATRHALAFTILTATRRDETRLAKWSEIDMDACLWVISGERTKMDGEDVRIPLSQQALDILRTVRTERAVDSEYIFANPDGMPLSANTLSNLLSREKIDSSVHGFRSAFRTWAVERTDASFEARENALSHQVGNQVVRAYERTDMLEERTDLMQSWADYIFEISID